MILRLAPHYGFCTSILNLGQEYFAEMGFHGFGLCWFESVVLSDKKKATTSKQV
jgi:hypothetical protein